MAADWVLAGVLTIIGVFALWFGKGHADNVGDPNVWATVAAIGATAPLALRRRSPVAVLGVVAPSQMLLVIFDYNSPGWISLSIAIYTVAAHTNGRKRSVTARIFAGGLFPVILGGLLDSRVDVGEVVSSIIFVVAAFVLGDNLQRRRRQVAEASELAAIATHQRDLVQRQQIQHERTRIARELHDVVAHSVSLMIIQAGAARRSINTSPLLAEAALRELESTGRQAMDELRRVLGVLRTGDVIAGADLAPQPTLSTIATLVRDDPQLQVRLTHSGAAINGVGADPPEVPPSVGLSLYRVVQEALTNVRKHAGPVKNVTVDIAYEAHQVSVHIADDGRGASVSFNDDGHGLVGMRERMALCGGTVVAGPRPGGGWHVRATAPLNQDQLQPQPIRATV